MSEQEMLEYIEYLECRSRILLQAVWDICDVGKYQGEKTFAEMCEQMRGIALDIEHRTKIGDL